MITPSFFSSSLHRKSYIHNPSFFSIPPSTIFFFLSSFLSLTLIQGFTAKDTHHSTIISRPPTVKTYLRHLYSFYFYNTPICFFSISSFPVHAPSTTAKDIHDNIFFSASFHFKLCLHPLYLLSLPFVTTSSSILLLFLSH